MDSGLSDREGGYTSEHLTQNSLWSEICHNLVGSDLAQSVGCLGYGLVPGRTAVGSEAGRDVSLFQRIETGSGTQKTSHLIGTEFFSQR
jgi:hypothetical protein